MDIPTHMLAGALVGQAFFRGRLGKEAPLVGALAALVPDLDLVAGVIGGPFAGLAYHRGPTHSVFLLPVVAALVGLGCWLVLKRRTSFGWLFLAALAAVALHPLFDVATNYGTMLLWPLTSQRFALDWVFIVDIYLAAILLVSLVISIRKSRRNEETYRKDAVRGLVLAAAYILFLGACQQMAMQKLARQLDAWGVPEESVRQMACLPVPLVPLAWNAFYVTEESAVGMGGADQAGPVRLTHVGTIWVARQGMATFQTSRSAPRSAAVRAVEESPEGRTFMWFARLPVVEAARLPDGRTVVEIYDARFETYLPGGGFLQEKIFHTPGTDRNRLTLRPFQIRGTVAADGKLESVAVVNG